MPPALAFILGHGVDRLADETRQRRQVSAR
jgi:hypothetical protein